MTPTIDADDLFAALADRKRRLILAYLIERDSATVEELRDHLVDRAGGSPGDLVATELYHQDLPFLDDAGLVRYDPDRRTVEATDLTDGRVAALLAIAPDAEHALPTVR